MNILLNSLFIFLLLALNSSYVFSEEITPSKIWMQETNFYNLKISSFKVSANKVHIGLNKADEIYFSSGDESISKAIISEDKIKIILKKNIKLINPKSHLQDIHISLDDYIYFSQVGIIDKKKKCRGLTISRLNSNFNSLSRIFHTRPCINKDVGLTSLSGTLASSDTDLFLSFINIIDPKNLVELSCSDMGYIKCLDYYKFMGTIYRIDKNTNEVELVSRGHRRPQGLFYVMTSNVLWENEHGPRGGDELNKIL